MPLRDYQSQGNDAIWQRWFTNDDALLVMATGLGKTEMFLDLCRRILEAHPEAVIYIVFNRVKLVEQTIKRAIRFGLPREKLGMVCNTLGKPRFGQINMCSVESLARIAHKLPKATALILDEAHRENPKEDSQYRRTVKFMRERNPRLKILGCTATPYRSRGYIFGNDGDLFQSITFHRDIKWAIANGYLVQPSIKHTDEQFDTSKLKMLGGDFDQGMLEELARDDDKVSKQVADAVKRLEGRKKVAWATTCIEHCERVRLKLLEIGQRAVTVHSGMSAEAQAAATRAFEEGDARHLVFVSIVSEGYDYPPIDGVVLMRPTRSPVLYIQTVGRGLRPAPNKEGCLVLDYGKVVLNCGPLDAPRIIQKDQRADSVPPPPMKFCPGCGEYLHVAVSQCPLCGHSFGDDKRDATKKLDMRHSDEAKLLSGRVVKSEKMPVGQVRLAWHQSRAGNRCIRISYYPTNYFRQPVHEYAMVGDKHMDGLSRAKLWRVGLTLEECLLNPVELPVAKRVPKAIAVKWGHYAEVTEAWYE